MSSVRELDRVADRIRQHRQVEKQPVLLVEGPDDLLVLKHHISPEWIFPAGGRKNVLEAVQELSAAAVVGVRGVIDSDYGGETEVPEGVLPYDRRDLESMLISLGVLANVIEHLGSASKIAEFGGVDALLKVLVENGDTVSRLRTANAANTWSLRFDKVDVADKTVLRSLTFEVDKYCRALIRASETTATESDLIEASQYWPLDALGPRGKDVAAFAGVALRSIVGSLRQAAATETLVSAQLRMSAGGQLGGSQWLVTLESSLTAAGLELSPTP